MLVHTKCPSLKVPPVQYGIANASNAKSIAIARAIPARSVFMDWCPSTPAAIIDGIRTARCDFGHGPDSGRAIPRQSRVGGKRSVLPFLAAPAAWRYWPRSFAPWSDTPNSNGLRANGFALLPIEAGAIREACPFHVSADARKEEDAQPDQSMILAAWPRSSGARQFCARCVFLNSMFEMRNCGFGPTKLWLWAN